MALEIIIRHCCKLALLVFLVPLFHVPSTHCIDTELKKEKSDFIQSCDDKRKGDIGEIPFWEDDTLPNHPRNVMKVHSRQKRFLYFPKGGKLVFTPEISFLKYTDDWHTLRMIIETPFILKLPKGPLIIPKFHDLEQETSYDREESSYGDYHISKRSLDYQRRTGFNIIQHALENLGLPGKACLLKVICETAEAPLESFGIIGEIFNMFLTPGYGRQSHEMRDFINAEEKGRKNGSCISSFTECPLNLIDFVQSGLNLLDSGITSASLFQGLRTVSF